MVHEIILGHAWAGKPDGALVALCALFLSLVGLVLALVASALPSVSALPIARIAPVLFICSFVAALLA